MDESLRQVSPHLPFVRIVFFRIQERRTTRGPGSLPPCLGLEAITLLMCGQGHEETTQGEGAFCLTKRSLVVPEPIGVAIDGECFRVRLESGDAARIVGGTAPRKAGRSNAASSWESSGERCQWPARWVACLAVSATILSASVSHFEFCSPGGNARSSTGGRRRLSGDCASTVGCRFPRYPHQVQSTVPQLR